VPDDVGLAHALETGMSSVEHMDGFVEALEADDSPIRNADPQTRGAKLHLYLDEAKIPALAARTREAGAYVTATHALYQTFMGAESVESLRARPELRYVPAKMVDQWAQQRAQQLQGLPPDAASVFRRLLELRDRILKGLSDAKAGVLLGSDAPQLFSVPGFSLQREMEAMAKAGLTPYQVLEAGTRTPAVYFGAAADSGTVEAGRRADLILLDRNPLADVRNMAGRAGVMVNGRWIPQAEIQKMLDAVAADMAAQK